MIQPKELLIYGNLPFPQNRILVIDIAGAPHRVNKISLCTLDQSFQYIEHVKQKGIKLVWR